MEWRDCVVIYIDLVGLRKRASGAKSKGSSLMRAFHALVANEMKSGLLSLDHAYVWNDSVLLLGYVDGSSGAYQACLRDAETLKRKVDQRVKSYAIAVKGQTFPQSPEVMADGGTSKTGRVTILRTSSYAMGNCFEIEKEVKKRKLRKSWYLDGRIAKHVKRPGPREVLKLKLLPKDQPRSVYLFDGYLWDGPNEALQAPVKNGPRLSA